MSKQSHTHGCWYPLKNRKGAVIGDVDSYSRNWCPETKTYWMTARGDGGEYEIKADGIEMILSLMPTEKPFYRLAK